ncbi:hypothetical protein ACJJTC_004494 [Scirpophaga incertulas]
MQVTESPLPIDFNESEIAKLIDDDIFESPKITCDYEISNINSNASIPSTSHPSPDCSIKHLDNDCSNHFCPYYIGKENELPFEAATYNNSPAFQSESSTPQANTLLSCFSNDSPQPQSLIRFRKDKGNVRKRHVKDWLDVKSGIISTDQRGKHSHHPKQITQVVTKSVCNHIQSLQPVESHFTRKRSEKLYLDGDLNYHRLFNMYTEWLETNSYEEKAKSERQYRDIFNENFKLSFYVPKKDQCDQCHIYKNIKTPTEEQITLHEQHIRSKNIGRELKQLDKNESKCSNG